MLHATFCPLSVRGSAVDRRYLTIQYNNALTAFQILHWFISLSPPVGMAFSELTEDNTDMGCLRTNQVPHSVVTLY
jgi:hypothetical protein